jgi:tetratricopeptide (TPR) repeat protein
MNKYDDKQINLLISEINGNPNDAKLYFNLSKAYFRSKQFIKSKYYAEKAIVLDPTIAEAYLILSYITYAMEKDINKCYGYAEQAYQIDPMSLNVLNYFGRINITFMKKKEGIRLLEQAIKISPSNKEILTNLILGHYMLSKNNQYYSEIKNLFHLYPSFTTGVWYLDGLFFNRYKDSNIYIAMHVVIFSLSFIVSFLLKTPGLLSIPIIYTIRSLLLGIYLFRYPRRFSAFFKITYSLLMLALLTYGIFILYRNIPLP